MIVLKMERDSTALALLRKGRLTTATVIPAGLNKLASGIVEKYGISSDMAIELLKYSVRLNQEICSKNLVHVWSVNNGETRTVSEQDLYDAVKENLHLWLNYIEKTCIPILQADQTAVMITGEGGETEGIDELLQKTLNVEAKAYIPETLGGRNAGLTACLGLFYAYQDRLPITGYQDNSLDMTSFMKAVSYREKKTSEENGTKEDTLTNKIKGIFLENKK